MISPLESSSKVKNSFGFLGFDLVHSKDPLMADESTSKDAVDEEWLKLSIGRSSYQYLPDDHLRRKSSNSLSFNDPSSSSAYYSKIRATNIAGMMGQTPSMSARNLGAGDSILHPQQDMNNWGFRPGLIRQPAPLVAEDSQLNIHLDSTVGSVSDFRVVHPPRRPNSGLWFTLIASQNQEEKPLLPQITRRYLRIKDGRMSISTVVKYLITKLTLETDSEIELRCRGQKLDPSLTLQHVRDNIWCKRPKEFITLLPNSSTTHHVMVLHYARSRIQPSN